MERKPVLSHYLQLCDLYEREPQEHSFGWYISWHLEHGFVFSTPDYFIMGRAIDLKDDFTEELIVTPKEKANAWFVHAMSGDMSKAWDILPWPLGYIAFERIRGGKRELQVFETERIRRLSQIPDA